MFGDYGLTTARILYRIPDYQNILQTFVWQEFDFHPEYPHLRKFLIFWKKKLDGPLYRVDVVHHGYESTFNFANTLLDLK